VVDESGTNIFRLLSSIPPFVFVFSQVLVLKAPVDEEIAKKVSQLFHSSLLRFLKNLTPLRWRQAESEERGAFILPAEWKFYS